MRRKKRKKGLDDSFELFLDTITNTFGGVLLIALLIVLMIRESKENAPNEQRSGATENSQMVQAEIESLEAEKERVVSDLETLVEFQRGFQTDELKALAQDLAQSVHANAELSTELISTRGELAQNNIMTQAAQSEIRQAEVLLLQKIAEREKASSELKNEESTRTRTMALPKQRITNKQEVPMFLESDKLFVLKDSASRFGFQLNQRYFQRSTVGDADAKFAGDFYKIKLASGLSVKNQAAGNELKKYNASNCFFTFVVRSDSFEAFGQLRNQCVKHGYEYRIIPSDELIGEGSSSTTKTQVP